MKILQISPVENFAAEESLLLVGNKKRAASQLQSSSWLDAFYKFWSPAKPKILRGNTCPRVNETIIKTLAAFKTNFADQRILDLPCGNGEFLQAVNQFFPLAKTTGADIKTPSEPLTGNFTKIDAQHSFEFNQSEKFQVITCISGIMEFDNTLSFFEKLKNHLNERGTLIVTNDNLLSVRDRFMYLLFGRTRQYHLFTEFSRPTWKVITIQNLRRILWEAGFEVEKIKYSPVSLKEWLWLPFAGLLYILQWLYLRNSEKSVGLNEKEKMLPFISLLSRHYIFVCRPVQPTEFSE